MDMTGWENCRWHTRRYSGLKLIFDSVDNIDEQTPQGVNVQEDLQINDKAGKVLIEVKDCPDFRPNQTLHS